MEQLDKIVRKLNNIQQQGGELTFSQVTRQLYNSKHTVTQIQDITLVLFKEYKSRKQIARVIRAYTKKSTCNLS